MTGLQPLPYHLDVVERLTRSEPSIWQSFADGPGRAAPVDLHRRLSQSADRLDPQTDRRLGPALAAATQALGVEVPVTVYRRQEGRSPDDELSYRRSLIHRRSEAVLTLAGELLERLTGPELTALFGHELAYHRLWSFDGGRFGVADRVLAALAADPGTPQPFLETARRWRLATELFADRGALAACGDLTSAVSFLVKAVTGQREVDVAGALREAAAAVPEAGGRDGADREGRLRTWAVCRWDAGRADTGRADTGHDDTGHDDAAAALLRPGLDLDRLDLADREALERLTRRLLERFLAAAAWSSDPAITHARAFFPDLAPAPNAPASDADPEPGPGQEPGGALLPPDASPATRRYLGYVLLDLATVDPDRQDRLLAVAGEVADRTGLGDTFAELARTEPAPGLATKPDTKPATKPDPEPDPEPDSGQERPVGTGGRRSR